MDAVSRRLEELERRVRALELASTHEPVHAPTSAPTTGPWPTAGIPPPHVRAPSVGAAQKRQDAAARPDFESWLGGVLLARVGIGAVVLAAAYFAQLAYRHVPDVGKVASLYALAGALLGVGHLLRTRVSQRFVGLLQGGAVAVAYVAGLAATLRYHLVDPWVGLALLSAAAALGTWLARRLKVEALAGVSVMGAMAAPYLLKLTHEPHVLVLGFAAVVNSWAAWTHARWGWIGTRRSALFGALVLGWAWCMSGRSNETALRLDVLHLYMLVLLAPELFAAWKARGPEISLRAIGLVAIGLLVTVLAVGEASGAGNLARDLAGRTLLSGALWLGLALGVAGRGRDSAALTRGLSVLGGLALVVGAWIHWDVPGMPAPRLIALAVLAPALLALRWRVESGALAAMLAAAVAWLTVGQEAGRIAIESAHALAPDTALALLPLALVPAAALVLLGRTASTIGAGTILGALTLFTAFALQAQVDAACWTAAFGGAAAWLALVAASARLRREPWAAWIAAGTLAALAFAWTLVGLVGERVPGWAPPWDPHTLGAVLIAVLVLVTRAHLTRAMLLPEAGASTLGAAALGLLVLAGGREVHLASRGLEGSWGPVLLSVYATLAAAGLLVLGFVRGSRELRLAALLLFACVIVKVGGHDLAPAALELRVLVTLVLGLVLLASAYGYTRRGREQPQDEEA